AGHDHEIRAIAGGPEHVQVVAKYVTEHGVECHRDPECGELSAQPLAVGIKRLPAGDLTADRDDFRSHSGSSYRRSASGRPGAVGDLRKDTRQEPLDRWHRIRYRQPLL